MENGIVSLYEDGEFLQWRKNKMSTYVISDIHGCYNEFLSMLEKIRFSGSDNLILAGDYIDRGKQSYEMLRWIEQCPQNVLLLRGNHEEEFASNIDLMRSVDRIEGLDTDFSSHMDTAALYGSVKYLLRQKKLPAMYFDLYSTIGMLLGQNHVTMYDLCRWAEEIRRMPYYWEAEIADRNYIVVHAGYADSLEGTGGRFGSLEQFFLYAREESLQSGGAAHSAIIAGHTPTIVKESFAYNAGNVFRYYDAGKDCVFYDIDCGCVFRDRNLEAKLACIRLEDEKIFYV